MSACVLRVVIVVSAGAAKFHDPHGPVATERHDGIGMRDRLELAAKRPVRSMRAATALIYLGLAMLAAVPGVFLKLGVATGVAPVDAWVSALGAGLADIRFGSGLRFWLGVMGATMMALLLLYPWRKVIGSRRFVGTVGGWFQIHIVFGIAGPVAILYHCNFGLGAFNANVALWSMLAVVLSGFAGHIIYAKVSAAFYDGRQRAADERDAIAAVLVRLKGPATHTQALLDAFDLFDTRQLAPRQSLRGHAAIRLRFHQQSTNLSNAVQAFVAQVSHSGQIDADDLEVVRDVLGKQLSDYARRVRRTRRRALAEQIAARWRLFHMPLFLIMVVAASLHVVAVWGVDGDGVSTSGVAEVQSVPAPMPATKAASPAKSPLQTRRVATVPSPASPAITAAPTLATPPKRAVRATNPVPPPAIAVSPMSVETAEARDAEAVYAEVERRSAEAPSVAKAEWPHTLVEQIALLKARRQTKKFAHAETETGFALTGKHAGVDCAECHTKPLRETRQPDPRACVSCHAQDDVHRGRRPACANCHTPNRWDQVQRRR